MAVSRRTALRVIYWNALLAGMIVCLGGVAFVRRIHRYDTLIVQVGREYNVDPRLIASVIWTESRFDPECVGPVGEVGLMQVTDGAAREWAAAAGRNPATRSELFDPRVNVRAGTWYLGRAIGHWAHMSDPLPYALAEYNAGAVNARRWAKMGERGPRDFWENITFPTTQRYVRNILRRYRGGV